MRNPLLVAASGLCALVLSAAISTPALAATNQQSGLVNVNVQDVTVQAPISVAVPVGVAANVCNVSAAVLAQQAGAGQAACTATSDSTALNQAVAQSMTGGGGGGGSSNNQSGLVNVNVQGLTLQLPVSVAVPIGVAADVCNVSAAVLAEQANGGSANCMATSTSTALNQAIARSITTV